MATPWQRNLAVCFFGSFVNIVAMTLLLPFLPLYVEQLGVTDHAAIVQWSGIAYGATFLSAALVAPLWGRLADRYGCKLNLIRASFGMVVAMSLIGLSQNIWELVALRLFVGLAGGYTSGSYVIVAAQTPKNRSAWALGVLSSGIMAGNLLGPLLGGVLPQWLGMRMTFFAASGFILLNLIATATLIHEAPRKAQDSKRHDARQDGTVGIGERKLVRAMWVTAALLMIANMSIEPIITVYVQQLLGSVERVTLVSGLAMSAAALGAIVSSSTLGKIADRIGRINVIVASLGVAGLLLIPQAFVAQAWQLVGLRFLMGLALGGILPCVTAVIRHNVPAGAVGRAQGYSTSWQYAGQVLGPLLGGVVGGHLGMRYVFLMTALLLVASALCNALLASAAARAPLSAQTSR